MLVLAPKLSQRTLSGSLLKYLSKLQVDEETTIRTNTTILLGNIASHLNDGTRKRVLINAFTFRALRDTFPPAFDAPIKLLFPTRDVVRPFSMLGLGDIVIPGIFVALALRFDVSRGTKSNYFKSAFSGYAFGVILTIVVMNWFQAAQPALLYIVPSVIGFLATHCFWNGEVKPLLEFDEPKSVVTGDDDVDENTSKKVEFWTFFLSDVVAPIFVDQFIFTGFSSNALSSSYHWIKRKGRPAPRDNAPIVVANHVSYIAPIFFFYESSPTIVASESNNTLLFMAIFG